MTANRTTWIWPFLAAVLLLGLMGGTPTKAQGTIASLVGGAYRAPSSLAASSSLIVSSAGIKATPGTSSNGAILFGKKGERSGIGAAPPTGSQEEPYTNYRVANHYLRSATVLIVRLPSRQPYLRVRIGAYPSSPRDPPFFLT
jgi:hypothetical protein